MTFAVMFRTGPRPRRCCRVRDVEHQRVIVLGADAFDHGANTVWIGCNSSCWRCWARCCSFVLALRDTLLLLLQVALLRLLGRGRERDGLLIERRDRPSRAAAAGAASSSRKPCTFLGERGLRAAYRRRPAGCPAS